MLQARSSKPPSKPLRPQLMRKEASKSQTASSQPKKSWATPSSSSSPATKHPRTSCTTRSSSSLCTPLRNGTFSPILTLSLAHVQLPHGNMQPIWASFGIVWLALLLMKHFASLPQSSEVRKSYAATTNPSQSTETCVLFPAKAIFILISSGQTTTNDISLTVPPKSPTNWTIWRILCRRDGC